MGKNRIAIEHIDDKRKRTVIKNKRRHGLVKKALELSTLCNQKIVLTIYDQDFDRMIVYQSHSDFDGIAASTKAEALFEKQK